MTNDTDLGETLVKASHIVRHRPKLGGRAGVLRRLAVLGQATGIHHVAAHAVVPTRTVRHLPGVHLGILVVANEPLHGAVQTDQVRIAHLLPATAAIGDGSRVPEADVRPRHLAPLGSRRTVKHQILHPRHGYTAL